MKKGYSQKQNLMVELDMCLCNTYGPLVKWFNTHAFHACIHGFKSRTGHQFLLINILYKYCEVEK